MNHLIIAGSNLLIQCAKQMHNRGELTNAQYDKMCERAKISSEKNKGMFDKNIEVIA